MRQRSYILCGVPHAGKSTLAAEISELHQDHAIYHTDRLVDLNWSEMSERVADMFDSSAYYIVEGCAAVRGLRKWLKRNPDTTLTDVVVVWMPDARDDLTPAQNNMAKGVRTIWGEIVEELGERGAEILTEQEMRSRLNV